MVALRKESVDRNKMIINCLMVGKRSLSARRAWIEISSLDSILAGVNVALRKESVDRNDFPVVPAELTTLSLSARRAWIEIFAGYKIEKPSPRRSPQGERG